MQMKPLYGGIWRGSLYFPSWEERRGWWLEGWVSGVTEEQKDGRYWWEREPVNMACVSSSVPARDAGGAKYLSNVVFRHRNSLYFFSSFFSLFTDMFRQINSMKNKMAPLSLMSWIQAKQHPSLIFRQRRRCRLREPDESWQDLWFMIWRLLTWTARARTCGQTGTSWHGSQDYLIIPE